MHAHGIYEPGCPCSKPGFPGTDGGQPFCSPYEKYISRQDKVLQALVRERRISPVVYRKVARENAIRELELS